ncbi:acyl-CoA dehydrogenase family protein [Methylobacterium sp. J-076]|uniref:acyl-CoA dehydrogenase family protein n=1 Tax=Methylobacterium sp. J-076 TaxID=2836655 RepID=UPI001FB895CC|nr:acyl-CoA dehydrogenase family protein [Methylobacterium sp. J-076]MCJ2013161.1 acyl-CoA dehydrogenase family protein [Methylobacterium sp. J-076]
MDFDLNEDQTLLRDSVERLCAGLYPSLEARQAHAKAPLGFPDANWQTFADLGIFGLPFPEEAGGFGGGPVETMLVMEAVGRHLVVEPLFPTLVLGATALRLGGSPEQLARLAPGLIEGALRLTLAHTERQSRYDLFDVATTARRDGDGFVLNGAKSIVPNADSAGLIVVSARVSGERRDRGGIGLFLVPADAPGVSLSPYPTQDGGRAAEVTFSDVALPADAALGDPEGGLPLLERVIEHGIAALAAEAVGSMETLHRLTVDYLKTRTQFGTAIGAFQALQHRAVDMLIELEQARSMALYAAMMVDSEDAAARAGALAAVKVRINTACRALGQEAVQLHGGIGMTMEYLGAHHFKRLAMIATQLGDTPHHLRTLTDAEDGLLAA